MPPKKPTRRSEASEFSVAVEQLTEEVRVLRQAVDELRDDVVWAARQLLGAGYEAAGQTPPRPVDPLAPDADNPASRDSRQSETPEDSLYCCDSPRLVWHGSPDVPGIACRNCGFVVAEEGNILIWREDRDDPDQSPPESEDTTMTELQGRLFQ